MIFLALRYLLERRRQTLLTLLGVFFGSMAYVTVSAYFLGFQTFMINQLVNNSAQIHIQARQDYLTDHQLDQAFFGKKFEYVFWATPPSGMQGYLGVQSPQSWYARLKADPRVLAYSPQLTAPALFSQAKISVSTALIGCDPAQQVKITSIADYMVSGKFTDIGTGGNRIILGDELMKRLGSGVGQTVLVGVGVNPPVPFRIVGRFYTGNRGADMQAFGSLSDVQKLNRTPNRVNEIGVRLVDYRLAAEIATNWSKIAPERSESWDQQNANFLSMIQIQTVLRFTMVITLLLVAGFGIYNVLNMTVSQKRQDIAILRSMGYDTFDIVVLFFSQGLIVGIFGSALGILCGDLLCRYLGTISFWPPNPANPSGHMLILLTFRIYWQALALALISVSVASVLPARSAGKLTPIEIIRSGG